MQEETDTVFRPSKLRALLEHFGTIGDPREPPKVRYPLREVLFLVVAATIADCEDYDEIALWGKNHLSFLRRFSEFHFGTPCADWLRVVMNRIDPALFSACFCDWARELRPDAARLIAIDGKSSRRSHDRKSGRRALHMVSAFATGARLVLAQEAVEEKENECAVIPDILDRLDLDGALVTIDAIACNPAVASAITSRKGAYVLAVKANQPTLHREIARYFDDPAAKCQTYTDTDKGHGRIEIRRYHISHEVGWLTGNHRYPDEPRFPDLAAIAMVETTVEQAGAVTTARRFYLSSAKLTPERLAEAVRGHWAIENSLHCWGGRPPNGIETCQSESLTISNEGAVRGTEYPYWHGHVKARVPTAWRQRRRATGPAQEDAPQGDGGFLCDMPADRDCDRSLRRFASLGAAADEARP